MPLPTTLYKERGSLLCVLVNARTKHEVSMVEKLIETPMMGLLIDMLQ